ncbi:MAG: biotin/lipoyl-binding protein [Pseudomonadota bacterium]
MPVLIGVATQTDVPIYLAGLGTVQAFNTVTVRARVDGQLDKVAFTEGQDVKAGDVLAQIDPPAAAGDLGAGDRRPRRATRPSSPMRDSISSGFNNLIAPRFRDPPERRYPACPG